MRVVIVGAGAMGSLFGFLLHRAGKDVRLLDSYPALSHHIKNHGLTVKGISGDHCIHLPITTNPQDLGPSDLLIVFVKSFDTAKAIADVSALIKEDSIVLTLQNGIGNVETIIEAVGEEKVLAGTTSHGATVIGLGHIRHAGIGETIIGAVAPNNTDRLNRAREFLASADIVVQTTNDVTSLLWSKLLINVGINPLTGITRLPNGDLLNYAETRDIMHRAVQEARDVASRKGIHLVYEDPFEKVDSVCAATAKNISSMLQDLRNRKRTEIDYINGAVVAEGENLGMSLPINQALTNLIRVKESLH